MRDVLQDGLNIDAQWTEVQGGRCIVPATRELIVDAATSDCQVAR